MRWFARIAVVAIAVVAMISAFVVHVSVNAADAGLNLRVLSNRPAMLSGGDALIRIDVPSGLSLRDVRITLNSTDRKSVV